MKRPVIGGVLLTSALVITGQTSSAAARLADTPGATAVTAAPGHAIKGAYIVTLKPGVEPRGLARALSVSPRYVYTEALVGFAAHLTPGQLRALERRPEVESIEEDQVVTTDARVPSSSQTIQSTQATPVGGGLYGLDRIDQRVLPLSGDYTTATTAPVVTAYVIDSGITTNHPDFSGRAASVYDALGGDGQDCNGHGTHVAGTIGGTIHGVAKDVQLRGVRVVGCNGGGSTSATIAGVDWVRANAAKPAVANMSLGGGLSKALNRAVETLAGSGVAVAVAAGNSGANACNTSPASANGVITVAASDRTDARASFSNTGTCVETYAPGVDITSAWLDGGTRTISGTSMASPHVAGAMALYKATGDKTTPAVNIWITNTATTSAIRANPTGTPNRLLYTGGL